MRQYEKSDCLWEAYNGLILGIGALTKNANMGGETTTIYHFIHGVQTPVWVPYGSRIQINEEPYTVLKGEEDESPNDRPQTCDKSIECLLNSNGEVESMSAHTGDIVTVLKVQKNLSQRLKRGLKSLVSFRKKSI